MSALRVLVVEDSLTVRAHLCAVLDADPGLEVVAAASDGKQAIELCRTLRPDVITLDMMLPVMSGLAATEYIMAHFPTPILIVSSSVNRGEIFKTYEALAAGAVDVLEKPDASADPEDWDQRLLATVKLVARIRVITHPRARLAPPLAAPRPSAGHPARRTPLSVVALGASTGGPGAVVEVLRGLPAPFPVPIVIVMHIGQPFGTPLADWLDGQTSHRVRCALDGEPFPAGPAVLLAPPERHLRLRGGRLQLTVEEPRHSCRPSVDVLFESIAADRGGSAAAALLTGMGKDGAQGLLGIRRAGGLTIAQDEATSVVYGMPREAALVGAASRVLPLTEIGPALAAAVTGERGR